MFSILRSSQTAALCLSTLLVSTLLAETAWAIDFIAPQIEHKMTTEGLKSGDDHLVTAKVTDDTAVASVTLHYRQRGTRNFHPLIMQNLDGSSHYEAVIVGSSIQDAGIEYFFEATDAAGNTLEMYGSDGEPFAIAVVDPNVELANQRLKGERGDARGSRSSLARASNDSVLPIKKKSSSKTWLWVGLGILAAAVIAGAAGGGGSDEPPVGPGDDNTGDLDLVTPVPVN